MHMQETFLRKQRLRFMAASNSIHGIFKSELCTENINAPIQITQPRHRYISIIKSHCFHDPIMMHYEQNFMILTRL